MSEMDNLVRIVDDKSGRTIKAVPLPEKYALFEDFDSLIGMTNKESEQFSRLFDLKAERNPRILEGPIPNSPIYGECHICGSQMPMNMGLKKGHPWYFYYCPTCDRYYRYR